MPQKKNDIINNQAIRKDTTTSAWFEKMIDHIRTDYLLYSSGVATPETKKFYDQLISGNTAAVFRNSRETSSRFFITSILREYVSELGSTNNKPLKLAMALTDSKLLVWAEIKDDDEAMENALLLTEAKINARYFDKGFYLSSTIVEESDNLSTPPQQSMPTWPGLQICTTERMKRSKMH